MAAITFGTVTEDHQWKIHNNIANAATATDTFQCSSNGLTMVYAEVFSVTTTVTAMVGHIWSAWRNNASTYGSIATGGGNSPFFNWGQSETTAGNVAADSGWSTFASIMAFTINSGTGVITFTITNENSSAQSYVVKYRIINVGP